MIREPGNRMSACKFGQTLKSELAGEEEAEMTIDRYSNGKQVERKSAKMEWKRTERNGIKRNGIELNWRRKWN